MENRLENLISYLDLLQLILETNAPRIIRFDGIIYYFQHEEYYSNDGDELALEITDMFVSQDLATEKCIEILEV